MSIHVFDNHLRGEDGQILASFSGHWPAVAAMIRLDDPNFRSLGGDAACDLAEEARLRELLRR